MTKRQKFFSALGTFFKNVFTKNIPLKIIALVFALLLWGYVLSEEKPKYVKRVYDVNIEYLNENRLKEWEVVKIEPSAVDVSIEAGIDMHSMLDKQRVKCYVDLGSVSLTDQDPDRKTVEISVITNIPDYGVLKDVSSGSAVLTFERVKSSDKLTATVRTEGKLPEIVKTNDTLPEYFECIPPKKVTVPSVTGLKSDIDLISGAEVTIDLSSFDNDDLSMVPGVYSVILPVTFKDANGKVIESSITKDAKVTVDGIEIRRYKEVPIVLDVSENAIDTDVYEYSCTIEKGQPTMVRIYGDAAELAKITKIETETITPRSGESDRTIPVALVIPEDARIKADQESTNVEVTVTKRQVSDQEFEIPVKYSDTDAGITLTDKTESIRIKVSGLADTMQVFNQNWFTASVDLKHHGEGKQRIPFTLRCKGIDMHIESYLVQEQSEDGEPTIRITFVTKEGLTYLIELEENTVEVVLNAVQNDTAH